MKLIRPSMVAFFSCCICSAAYGADSNAYIADQNGCLAENQRPVPNERVTWSGPCKDGFLDGEGTLTWYVGDEQSLIYIGRMERGKRDGKGRQTSASKYVYDGEWKDGGY